MLKPILLIGLILGVSVATNPAAQSGRPSATPSSNEPALTALDYIEIEQLVYRYGWALDNGENNGYAYADLYAPDGTFTGTNQAPSGRTYQGRDNLAALARGGRRGPFYISHLVTNVVITPTSEGAVGRAYVGIFDLGEPGSKSPSAGHGGFYDDVYVKTSDGWRFKKRSYYESKWGEPNVEIPSPIPPVRALKEAKAPAAATAKRPTLTAQDYVELQQLVAKYPYGLDVNGDNGRSYANLFTPEGAFGCVMPNAGTGAQQRCVTDSGQLTPQARPRAQGHDALAKMVDTEEPHGPNYARHFIFNHVIEPTATGAKGKEYAAVIDIMPGQQAQQAHSIYLVGRYDDEYVKTPQGWRFKTRVFTTAARREPPAASR
jgi:hypothetical protein